MWCVLVETETEAVEFGSGDSEADPQGVGVARLCEGGLAIGLGGYVEGDSMKLGLEEVLLVEGIGPSKLGWEEG